MKIITKIIGVGIFSSLLFSCGTVVHDRLQTGNIVRDCTGTYIRVEGNGDYLVCNSAILKDYKEGDKVSVVYDFTKKCTEQENKIVCMMYHENKGMIQIKSIK